MQTCEDFTDQVISTFFLLMEHVKNLYCDVPLIFIKSYK